MADRSRTRVGRVVTYSPTDAQAAAGGGDAGELWPATITAVSTTGTVNLHVFRTNGSTLAVTGISQGQNKGEYSIRGLASVA